MSECIRGAECYRSFKVSATTVRWQECLTRFCRRCFRRAAAIKQPQPHDMELANVSFSAEMRYCEQESVPWV